MDETRTDIDVNVDTDTQAIAPEDREWKQSRTDRNMIGWGNVLIGGGVEGQAGDLAGNLAAGPMWQASLAVQPLTWMGLEGAYIGSVHELDTDLTGEENDGAVNGADFVHNGAQLAATFNLPTPFLQPYALGGIGVDRYNFRGDEGGIFSDDTAGRVPVGGGLKASAGNFVADLRGQYNVLFDQEFARSTDNNGGTYNIGLNVGATF